MRSEEEVLKIRKKALLVMKQAKILGHEDTRKKYDDIVTWLDWYLEKMNLI